MSIVEFILYRRWLVGIWKMLINLHNGTVFRIKKSFTCIIRGNLKTCLGLFDLPKAFMALFWFEAFLVVLAFYFFQLKSYFPYLSWRISICFHSKRLCWFVKNSPSRAKTSPKRKNKTLSLSKTLTLISWMFQASSFENSVSTMGILGSSTFHFEYEMCHPPKPMHAPTLFKHQKSATLEWDAESQSVKQKWQLKVIQFVYLY